MSEQAAGALARDRASVVVVGAGPAGLSTAAMLGRRGVQALVLEQANAIGASWRGRYDHLRLNSSRWFSQLPGARYAPGTGVFPPRDEIVRYLESYAAHNQLQVRLHTRLDRIDPLASGWLLRTSTGDVLANQVVVACGFERVPLIPDWPGRDRFSGALLHAADYRNARPYQDQDVLVVGPGSSGMEIAAELASSGARSVCLSVRTPPNIILRTALGPLFARIFLTLPPGFADRLMERVRRKEIGDLSAQGLAWPKDGVFTRLAREGVAPAIVDMPTIQAIREGRIKIVAAVESMDETEVRLADGTRVQPQAVVAATGYRRGLEPIVGHLGVLGRLGAPRATNGDPAAPGLRFIGYVPVPAQLGFIGREARRAARQISSELGGAAHAQRPGPGPVTARGEPAHPVPAP